MSVTKSNKNNITSPDGNSLAVFVDVSDNTLKLKDVNGLTDNVSDYVSGGGGGVTSVGVTSSTLTVTNSPITASGDIDIEIPDGFLKVGTGVTGSLQPVTDTSGTATPLNLSTSLVQSTSTVKITTTDTDYIDCEDGAGNNRFTVSRNSASQTVNVDFASNPTLDDTVGAIRTVKGGGANPLTEILSFNRDGQVSVNGNELVNYVPDLTSGGALAITSANYALYNATVYNVTGAVTISVDNTVPDGFNMTIIQQDANQCVIAAGAGLTLRNNDNHTASAGQWAVIKIIRSGANLLLSGDTAVNPALFGTAYMFVELLVDNENPSFLIGTELQAAPYSNATFFGFYLASFGAFNNADVVNYTRLDWGGIYPAVVEIPVPPQSGGVDSFGIEQVQYLMESFLIAQGSYTQAIFSFFIPTADTGSLTMQNMYINDSVVLGDCGVNTAPSFLCVGAFTNSILTVTSADVTAGAKIPAGTYRIYNDYQLGGGATNFDLNNATQPIYFRGQNIF